MLFDVTALLVTSAALGPAAEAFGVPQNFSTSISLSVPADGLSADVLPAEAAGPSAPYLSNFIDSNQNGVLIDPGAVSHSVSLTSFTVPQSGAKQLASLTGAPLLRGLATLPRAQISAYISSHPAAVTKLLAAPPTAREVNGWWQSLASSEKSRMAAAAPQLVGNLDGVPTSVRESANRVWIAQSQKQMVAEEAGVAGRAQAQDASHQLHMLQQVQSALTTAKSGPTRSLLSVDPSGQGKAAIVIGNLSKADYVTYLVPGMFFTVDGQIDDWTADAARIYDQQNQWLSLLHESDPGAPQKTVAVVAWMGYQTPDLTNIGSLDLAYQGRDALARAIEGLQTDRSGNEPYTTIVAHSYGSTAALMALTDYSFHVNALVLVGSPGSAAQSVKDLHVDGGNVWVGAAAWDPVPSSAWFGSDPGSPSYGAKTMAVSGGRDVITGAELKGSTGHNEYFAAGTQSVRNMALIGIGHPELVSRGTAADKTRTLALER